MTFPARVFLDVFHDNPASDWGVTLVRAIDLPFPPTRGVRLDLACTADDDPDDYDILSYRGMVVETSIWRAGFGHFQVNVEPVRSGCPKGELVWLIGAGFRLHMPFPHATPEGADEVEPGEYHIVRVDGSYHAFNDAELECVRVQGGAVEVVKWRNPKPIPKGDFS